MSYYTFISGATGGIGRAFAQAAAKKGYPLFLTGRSVEKLSALASELSAASPEIKYFACDLTSESSVKSMLAFADDNDVKFDRILNVAGVDTQKAFTDYTYDKVAFQIKVNVLATTFLTYELLKRRAPKTELLAISSMSGASPMPYFALYSASKSYITSLYTSLHYELKKEGVKVTAVLPGGVPTRPDIVADIKGQGLWGRLSSKSASFVAEKSLKAVRKNKTVYVPGFFNKFLYFLIKIAPKKITLSFIARRWKKIEKDAF